MSGADYLWLLAFMGLVTYLPRWLPLQVLARRRLPEWLEEWLGLIPVAILSALLAPSLLLDGTPRSLDWSRPELWVALPTFLFAWQTRSLAGTVLVGMGLFWLVGVLL